MERIVKSVSILLLIPTLFGCASTGRGTFPPFYESNLNEKTLAIVPPQGGSTDNLRRGFVTHLDVDRLERRFKNIRFVSEAQIEHVFGENFDGDLFPAYRRRKLAKSIGTDLVLVVRARDFAVEKFDETSTLELYNYQTTTSHTTYSEIETGSVNSTDVDVGVNGSKSSEVSGQVGSDSSRVTLCHKPGTPAEQTLTVSKSAKDAHLNHGDTRGACGGDSNTSNGSSNSNVSVNVDVDSRNGSEESRAFGTVLRTRYTSGGDQIPISEGKVRSILSVNALLYDSRTNTPLWKGSRLERSQGKYVDISPIELTDIVIERMANKLANSLLGN